LNSRQAPQARSVIRPEWISSHNGVSATSKGVLRQFGRIIAVRKSKTGTDRAHFGADGCDALLDFHARVPPRFASENGMTAAVSADCEPARAQASRLIP